MIAHANANRKRLPKASVFTLPLLCPGKPGWAFLFTLTSPSAPCNTSRSASLEIKTSLIRPFNLHLDKPSLIPILLQQFQTKPQPPAVQCCCSPYSSIVGTLAKPSILPPIQPNTSSTLDLDIYFTMSSAYDSSSPSSDSDSASSSSGYRYSMDSAQRPTVSIEVLRCLRCARSVEATSTDDITAMGMVRIAHNLYYCERCAKMVGYK